MNVMTKPPRKGKPGFGEPGWRPAGVHPAADAFPMMHEGELAELAADIKANGQIHPIVVDAGLLIDGRNRLAACELAGVEPTFSNLDGRDPLAFIVGANLARRDLTKGQKAMAMALIYPKTEKGGRGKKSEALNSAETAGFSTRRLNEARSVLSHALALAESVRDGRVSLDDAMKTVAEERKISETMEAAMDELRRDAPDLMDLVTEERLTVKEAYAAFRKREAEAEVAEANKREIMFRLGETAWQATTAWASQNFLADLTERLKDKEFRRSFLARMRFDPDRMDDVLVGAKALAALLEKLTKEGSDV